MIKLSYARRQAHNVLWDETIAKLFTYGVVLFMKKRYVSKNVTELFRRLNRARELRFSLKCASFLPPDHFLYLNFKNPFRRTSGHNCSYNYLHLSFFSLEKVCRNIILTFNHWIKDTDCLRGLSWSLVGGCRQQKFSVKKD